MNGGSAPLFGPEYLRLRGALGGDPNWAWQQISPFLASPDANILERLALAEEFIDLFGRDLIDQVLADANDNPVIAEVLGHAHLGDIPGLEIDRLREWQDEFHFAKEAGNLRGSPGD